MNKNQLRYKINLIWVFIYQQNIQAGYEIGLKHFKKRIKKKLLFKMLSKIKESFHFLTHKFLFFWRILKNFKKLLTDCKSLCIDFSLLHHLKFTARCNIFPI